MIIQKQKKINNHRNRAYYYCNYYCFNPKDIIQSMYKTTQCKRGESAYPGWLVFLKHTSKSNRAETLDHYYITISSVFIKCHCVVKNHQSMALSNFM